jgi:SAM-dependent methyltransferase
MSLQDVMPAVGRLAASAEALAVLAAAVGRPLDAQPAQVREVLVSLGVENAAAELGVAEAEFVNGLVRTVLLQAVEFLDAPNRPAGWTHADPRILQGQGTASASLVSVLRNVVVPRLDGLAARLKAPVATFLDVGVGVAAISIAVCRAWPTVHVVGLDPFEPALELARQNIAEASLQDRVGLRRIGAQDLTDADAFDLAWFSLPFVPDAVLDPALAAVCRSLRPGGWLVTGTFGGPGELGMALARLRTVRAGGRLLDSAGTERLLAVCGLTNIASFPPATWAPGILTVGRRPIG